MKTQTTQQAKEAFTSGEWIVKTDDGVTYLLVETNDKNCHTICKCFVKPEESIPLKEAEANARLIAESKNMYKALKDLCEWHNIDCYGSNITSDKYYAELGKRFSKAKAIINRIDNSQK